MASENWVVTPPALYTADTGKMIRTGRRHHLSSNEVRTEVTAAYDAQREISDDAAVTIASWWQSVSNPGFTRLCSGLPVAQSDIADDIVRELKTTRPIGFDRLCLDMLGTWALNWEGASTWR